MQRWEKSAFGAPREHEERRDHDPQSHGFIKQTDHIVPARLFALDYSGKRRNTPGASSKYHQQPQLLDDDFQERGRPSLYQLQCDKSNDIPIPFLFSFVCNH